MWMHNWIHNSTCKRINVCTFEFWAVFNSRIIRWIHEDATLRFKTLVSVMEFGLIQIRFWLVSKMLGNLWHAGSLDRKHPCLSAKRKYKRGCVVQVRWVEKRFYFDVIVPTKAKPRVLKLKIIPQLALSLNEARVALKWVVKKGSVILLLIFLGW